LRDRARIEDVAATVVVVPLLGGRFTDCDR